MTENRQFIQYHDQYEANTPQIVQTTSTFAVMDSFTTGDGTIP